MLQDNILPATPWIYIISPDIPTAQETFQNSHALFESVPASQAPRRCTAIPNAEVGVKVNEIILLMFHKEHWALPLCKELYKY